MDFVYHSRLHLGSKGKTFEKAKVLRSNTTVAEQTLWFHLKNKRLGGYKFRGQHPVLNYIADFYCHEANLIVEVDGEVHNNLDATEHDSARTEALEEYDIRVIRFTNNEISNSIEDVLRQITIAIEQRIDRRNFNNEDPSN